jgi:MOSC domain-containing protein YiiM
MREWRRPIGYVIAVAAAATHQLSKPIVDEIRLVKDLGVEGDAHLGATTQHQMQARSDSTRPNLRQVHLLQSELFSELAQKGHVVGPATLGENITTAGVDLISLPRGTLLLLRIGSDAVLQLTGLRNPCGQLDAFQPGLARAMLGKDEGGELIRKARVMSVVISGGTIRTGDEIAIELPLQPFEKLCPV